MSITPNRVQRRALARRKQYLTTPVALPVEQEPLNQSLWTELKSGLWAMILGLVMLALVVTLSACGTPQTQARVVHQAPPRPDAELLARPMSVPELFEPVTAQSILLKHADEMAERNGLAAQLNALIDWVEKISE